MFEICTARSGGARVYQAGKYRRPTSAGEVEWVRATTYGKPNTGLEGACGLRSVLPLWRYGASLMQACYNQNGNHKTEARITMQKALQEDEERLASDFKCRQTIWTWNCTGAGQFLMQNIFFKLLPRKLEQPSGDVNNKSLFGYLRV